ncbi:hypothetical protein ACFLTV_03195, partial [Chloroflexota bacterium]
GAGLGAGAGAGLGAGAGAGLGAGAGAAQASKVNIKHRLTTSMINFFFIISIPPERMSENFL